MHNLWKFQLSIINGSERARIAYFESVRGCVILFCVKSCNLYQFCTICENFRFPSLTVQNRLFWARERLRDFILCKISQPLPILHNLWKFQLSIMGITFPKPPNTSYEVLAAPSFWSYWSNWIFGPLYRWLGRLGQRSSLFLFPSGGYKFANKNKDDLCPSLPNWT